MDKPEEKESPLGSLRALDLTDEKGMLCGKILADLGVEVIKVERPSGDPARSIGPFYRDDPDPQKSLYWFAFNLNKRGITLNIETAEGQDLFRRLAKGVDFVIESFPPGYLERLGLGYSELCALNPGVILTSIAPFGQTGPYRDYKGPDIVSMAMGGYMYLTGDPDRPPVRVSFPQAYLLAGAEAAVGTMMAYYHRRRNGEGQQVDVSMQECVIWSLMNARLFWNLNRVNLRRAGPFRVGLSSGAKQQQTWPCRDGYVTFIIATGGAGARSMWELEKWIREEGVGSDLLLNTDWDNFDMAMANQEFMDRVSEPIRAFFLTHTRDELYEEAIKRRIMLYPVATASDWLESPQLAARDFWVKVEHPELGGSLAYPGAFIKASEMSLKISRRAPLIGEHNQEIYGELGLSPGELSALKQAGVL